MWWCVTEFDALQCHDQNPMSEVTHLWANFRRLQLNQNWVSTHRALPSLLPLPNFASTSKSLHTSPISHARVKMPPKKAPVAEKKSILGRPGNNLKIGIVGLPNVGKSSFFNVLSKTGASRPAIPFGFRIRTSVCSLLDSHISLSCGALLRSWKSCQLPICHY